MYECLALMRFEIPRGKTHVDPLDSTMARPMETLSQLVMTCGEFTWPLCLLPRLHMLQALLAFAMPRLPGILSFTLSVMGKAGIT